MYLGYLKYDVMYQTLCRSHRGPDGSSKKNRLDHHKNLPNRQLHGTIALQEHTPSKNGKFFHGYLNFPISSRSFLPTRRPCSHFCSKKNIQHLVFQFFLLEWVLTILYCDLITRYARKHIVMAPYFNSISTGYVSHVLRFPLKKLCIY